MSHLNHTLETGETNAQCVGTVETNASVHRAQLRLMQAFPAFSDAPRHTALRHSSSNIPQIPKTVHTGVYRTTALRVHDATQSTHLSGTQVHSFPDSVEQGGGGGSVAN